MVMGIYLARHKKRSRKVEGKISKAREWGLHEPTSIHPRIDKARCIGSGACVKACPEKDILGLSGGKGRLINASQCIGHGACAIACPVEAITLVFGTETRGVDIPWVSPTFETNVPGVFIVGELGGMGLIKNAVTQGREAIDHIAGMLRERAAEKTNYDVLIVGAGPAGIGASLAATRHKLRFVTIDQNDLGGTVLQYPRHKIVMTSPMELPMYGKVRLKETTKESLLELWQEVCGKAGLKINSNEKMTGLTRDGCSRFIVTTAKAEYVTKFVMLAIGRRGTPRKLGVPGEGLSKVTYSLKDPEQHSDEHIIVVGGGDSAVEAALALSAQPGNTVTLSYRKDRFSRIKPGNRERLEEALAKKTLTVAFNSNVTEIKEKEVLLEEGGATRTLPNDYVYIFAGGELPNEFLKSIGIKIEKKFGTPLHEAS
ncbi:MAG: NAD(P)-binding domain-containing protein [Thermodesulfobacteriota bacterium]